ncbi:hypothetical protein N9A94_08720 [Akkermansiaceae bacterium]|nr:hypothetical protein [Akkermansiaceae bacterium]
MIWRRRQVIRDRKAGMVFDWRRGHGSTGRLFFATIVSFLIFGIILGYVQFRLPEQPVLKEQMADVTFVDISEKSNRWLAEVFEEESPFAHRWEVASSKSLEEEITRQLSTVSPRHYQPALREVPLPEKPLTLVSLPGLGPKNIPPPEEVERKAVILPVARWALSVKPVSESGGWKGAIIDWEESDKRLSEGEVWTILLGLDWRGRVLNCSPLAGDEDEVGERVFKRLREARYPAIERHGAERWITIEVRLVNLATEE